MINISPHDLYFGQQHLGTQAFLTERYGQYHTIPLRLFPHYRFLNGETDVYLDYLESSWSYICPGRNTVEYRVQRVQRFQNQLYSVPEPITICQRPDGRWLVIDGNHRAAIAGYRGMITIKARVIPLEQHLRSIVGGTPYQSVGPIEGRRPDTVERMALVRKADLLGKRVLDLGCNLGMSCYLSECKEATGVDSDREIVSSAIRLNSIFAKNCWFVWSDLNNDTDYGPFDTIFCFSLYSHVRNKEALIGLLERSIERGNILYFEGHAGTKIGDYPFLSHYKCELLGHTRDGVHTDARTRPFWRVHEI